MPALCLGRLRYSEERCFFSRGQDAVATARSGNAWIYGTFLTQAQSFLPDLAPAVWEYPNGFLGHYPVNKLVGLHEILKEEAEEEGERGQHECRWLAV